MWRTLEEDLKVLQALGWRWKRWARKEANRLRRQRPLRSSPEAPGEPPQDLDLGWVLDGDRLSEGLTAHERYCLYVTYQAGSARQAALRFSLYREDLEETLAEIGDYLYDKGFHEAASR